MNLLETVLNNTVSRGPVIVSEQHDRNKIAVDEAAITAALRGRAGVWDAAEFGITAARAAEMLAAADTPEAREEVLVDLRRRAIRRASLATANGKLCLAGDCQAPWHRLGVNVAEAMTSEEAILLASLGWRVEKHQLRYLNPVTNAMCDADGKYAVVRQDTGDMLGTVGRFYQPIQNADGFKFLDGVLSQFGARYESAGAIYNGSQVWMLVHLPEQAFSVGGSDRVEPYAIFTNSHDGTSAARCFPTSERVVCANTFRLASADAGKGISIRHTGDIKNRIASAQTALGLTVKQVEQFAENADVLSRTKVEPLPYFNGLLDAVLDITAADASKGCSVLAAALARSDVDLAVEESRIQREIDKRKNILEDILGRYESATNGVNGMRGTGWAAFNAVTESADHGQLGGRHVGKDKESRRFESVLSGQADVAKQIAYEQVMTLAG